MHWLIAALGLCTSGPLLALTPKEALIPPSQPYLCNCAKPQLCNSRCGKPPRLRASEPAHLFQYPSNGSNPSIANLVPSLTVPLAAVERVTASAGETFACFIGVIYIYNACSMLFEFDGNSVPTLARTLPPTLTLTLIRTSKSPPSINVSITVHCAL